MTSSTESVAILASGCFWCSEAIFSTLIGVSSVKPGYIGGHIAHPSYEDVRTGDTGHAEAIRILYDARQISYTELLDIFFHTHDPTTRNRQGEDIGPQYRSAIFASTPDEREVARYAIDAASTIWTDPIVTTVEPGTLTWYPAETYHRDYFANNAGTSSYCSLIVAPKLLKFRQKYAHRIKPEGMTS